MVLLDVADQELGEAGDGTDEENEETRRERIERAGVTDARHAEHAARTRHDVVGRGARRLVDKEGAMEGGCQL